MRTIALFLFLFYRLTLSSQEIAICGHDTNSYSQPVNLVEASAGECVKYTYRIWADYSMFQKFGSSIAVRNEIVAIVDLMNSDYVGSFSNEVYFEIDTIIVSTSASQDFFYDSIPTSMSNQLLQFQNTVRFLPDASSYDIGSLWTADNFSPGTIGVAYVGTICGQFAYNVLQHFTSSYNDLRNLNSHEIGHNFSANHDPASGLIMSPNVSGSTTWSSASINNVNSKLATNSCHDLCAIQYPDTCINAVIINDTTVNQILIDVYDTNVVNINDTVHFFIPVYDTIQDTITEVFYETVIEYDTIYEYIELYDTTIIEVIIRDTNNFLFVDTTYIIDTVVVTVYELDTLYLTDTIILTDTICDFTTGYLEIIKRELEKNQGGVFDMLGREVGAIRKQGYYIINGRVYYVGF